MMSVNGKYPNQIFSQKPSNQPVFKVIAINKCQLSSLFLISSREYDTLQLQLESSMSRIENEVKQYQEEILANETKNNLLELKKMQLDLLEKRANDEVKLYVSNKVLIF